METDREPAPTFPSAAWFHRRRRCNASSSDRRTLQFNPIRARKMIHRMLLVLACTKSINYYCSIMDALPLVAVCLGPALVRDHCHGGHHWIDHRSQSCSATPSRVSGGLPPQSPIPFSFFPGFDDFRLAHDSPFHANLPQHSLLLVPLLALAYSHCPTILEIPVLAVSPVMIVSRQLP